MLDEATPRELQERTGKHRCIRCLADTPSEEFLRNDHLCDACAQKGDESDGDVSSLGMTP